MSESHAAVSFREVSFARVGRVVLEKLSFDIEAGETLVLLGRSGSGKTTALKMVNGMLLPDSGEVLVDGKPTKAWDPIRLKRSIGYVIQETGLFPHFTVARNVGLGPSLEGWPPERIARRTREILETVGLDPAEFGTRYPRELSGGQKQRVGVARALAANPALLLFDEPFGALDPITRFELQEQFLTLRRTLGSTSVFVTHDIREALRLATKIALLKDGSLEVIGSPDEFVRASTPEASSFLKSIRDN